MFRRHWQQLLLCRVRVEATSSKLDNRRAYHLEALPPCPRRRSRDHTSLAAEGSAPLEAHRQTDKDEWRPCPAPDNRTSEPLLRSPARHLFLAGTSRRVRNALLCRPAQRPCVTNVGPRHSPALFRRRRGTLFLAQPVLLHRLVPHAAVPQWQQLVRAKLVGRRRSLRRSTVRGPHRALSSEARSLSIPAKSPAKQNQLERGTFLFASEHERFVRN